MPLHPKVLLRNLDRDESSSESAFRDLGRGDRRGQVRQVKLETFKIKFESPI